jgi:hypothetical protein
MGGVDEYLERTKKEIFKRVYDQHYYQKLNEVSNVVAMRKRKELEAKLTAKLFFTLIGKIE